MKKPSMPKMKAGAKPHLRARKIAVAPPSAFPALPVAFPSEPSAQPMPQTSMGPAPNDSTASAPPEGMPAGGGAGMMGG